MTMATTNSTLNLSKTGYIHPIDTCDVHAMTKNQFHEDHGRRKHTHRLESYAAQTQKTVLAKPKKQNIFWETPPNPALLCRMSTKFKGGFETTSG